ncbi:hypothetical protein [Acinetobacter rudis]|uniref:Nuclear transport factor 2 family protein n=1 Tax=Acinetobacter rudis CIP 110305 TaxID=421052 RepID=S3PSM5_9GAMM|nr:hypothetical protein [Acinetobacter rudis]EPF81706.1 hypothetical protein F945_00041 [Acinetobacter rudis CIP 110305]
MQDLLEQSRTAWSDAYYRGDSEQLQHHEHPDLHIVYEAKGIVESNINRYEQIAHAVKNSVWKPQKPSIEIEEFEFNSTMDRCIVRLKPHENLILIQETWIFEQSWQLIELRFCQKKPILHE